MAHASASPGAAKSASSAVRQVIYMLSCTLKNIHFLSARATICTMDGEHSLKIPEGTQPGTTFRIRNKGFAVLNGHGKGDLYVEARVQIPAKLNKRQRELLHELDGIAKVDNQPLLQSLLGKVKEIFG
jgi:molecular chaperone DnaJ